MLSGPSWFPGSSGFKLLFGSSPFIKSANNAGCRLSSSTAKRLTAPSFRPFISSYENLKDMIKNVLESTKIQLVCNIMVSRLNVKEFNGKKHPNPLLETICIGFKPSIISFNKLHW